MSYSLVSIIVPIYNAEAYLHTCMQRIIKQTYQQIEIILVNDGSTDESGAICDAYAKMDERVKVVHQENAGPSAARNKGIQTAIGDYIQFVDADDYMETNMTEMLVDAMSPNVQLVICGYVSISRSNEHSKPKENIPSIEGVYSHALFMNHFGQLYKDILLPSILNKLYVADLIDAHTIHFSEDLNMGEDLLFNLAYLHVCTHISIIPHALYNYVTSNQHSLSKRFNQNLLANQQMLDREVKAFLLKHNSYQGENEHLHKVIYTTSIVNCLHNLFHEQSTLTDKEKKDQIAIIIADEYVHEHLSYFKDNLQHRLIGRLIKVKSVYGIYAFFKMKMKMQHKMHPIYRMAKKLNQNVLT